MELDYEKRLAKHNETRRQIEEAKAIRKQIHEKIKAENIARMKEEHAEKYRQLMKYRQEVAERRQKREESIKSNFKFILDSLNEESKHWITRANVHQKITTDFFIKPGNTGIYLYSTSDYLQYSVFPSELESIFENLNDDLTILSDDLILKNHDVIDQADIQTKRLDSLKERFIPEYDSEFNSEDYFHFLTPSDNQNDESIQKDGLQQPSSKSGIVTRRKRILDESNTDAFQDTNLDDFKDIENIDDDLNMNNDNVEFSETSNEDQLSIAMKLIEQKDQRHLKEERQFNRAQSHNDIIHEVKRETKEMNYRRIQQEKKNQKYGTPLKRFIRDS